MKSIKDYDRQVCWAVKNDPLGFIDVLLMTAEDQPYNMLMLREAACVIANLMERLEIPEKNNF